tara:strand:- start:282 stop:479 length:198 start_codon:yes stop_codon:yes gene_type:complete
MNVSDQFERHFNAELFKGSEPRTTPVEPEHDLAWESEMQWEWGRTCGSPMWDELKAQEADSEEAS